MCNLDIRDHTSRAEVQAGPSVQLLLVHDLGRHGLAHLGWLVLAGPTVS
jgi:hypothetical protein